MLVVRTRCGVNRHCFVGTPLWIVGIVSHGSWGALKSSEHHEENPVKKTNRIASQIISKDLCLCLYGLMPFCTSASFWGGDWKRSGPRTLTMTFKSHRIHGTGIFTYIYHKNQPFMMWVNIPCMDPMGNNIFTSSLVLKPHNLLPKKPTESCFCGDEASEMTP